MNFYITLEKRVIKKRRIKLRKIAAHDDRLLATLQPSNSAVLPATEPAPLNLDSAVISPVTRSSTNSRIWRRDGWRSIKAVARRRRYRRTTLLQARMSCTLCVQKTSTFYFLNVDNSVKHNRFLVCEIMRISDMETYRLVHLICQM